MYIILVLLCLGIVNGAENVSCVGNFSYEYYEIKNNLSNSVQFNTYGGNFNNKCLNFSTNTARQSYINILISNGVFCSGTLCNGGNFTYDLINNSYGINFIIDQNNTPYDTCNPLILGNMIMVIDEWDQEIEDRCWTDIKREKIAVLGINVFCSAIKNIITCSGCNASLPIECINNNQTIINDKTGAIVGIVILILAVTIAVTLICASKKDSIKSFVIGRYFARL